MLAGLRAVIHWVKSGGSPLSSLSTLPPYNADDFVIQVANYSFLYSFGSLVSSTLFSGKSHTAQRYPASDEIRRWVPTGKRRPDCWRVKAQNWFLSLLPFTLSRSRQRWGRPNKSTMKQWTLKVHLWFDRHMEIYTFRNVEHGSSTETPGAKGKC